MRMLTIAAACLAITLTAPLVMADGHKGKKMFKKTDTDSDGFISLDEMKAAQQKRWEQSIARFEKADTDKDGKLSQKEAKTLHEMRRAERKKRKKHD